MLGEQQKFPVTWLAVPPGCWEASRWAWIILWISEWRPWQCVAACSGTCTGECQRPLLLTNYSSQFTILPHHGFYIPLLYMSYSYCFRYQQLSSSTLARSAPLSDYGTTNCFQNHHIGCLVSWKYTTLCLICSSYDSFCPMQASRLQLLDQANATHMTVCNIVFNFYAYLWFMYTLL